MGKAPGTQSGIFLEFVQGIARGESVRVHAFQPLASRSHSYGLAPIPETCPPWLGGAGCRRLAESPCTAGRQPSSGRVSPNIVYILADDLGYGDVHCFNPERGKIPTPNLDRLAGQGMRFTDAHSGSAVCTPTRYGNIQHPVRCQGGL